MLWYGDTKHVLKTSYSTVLYRYTFCVYISVLKCAHYSTDFGTRVEAEW